MDTVRSELRAPLFVSLRMRWTDQNGEEHSEIVSTVDVSAHGMRIRRGDLRCKSGDEVILTCAGSSMRFRVVWIGETGTPGEGEVALQVSVPGEDTSRFALSLAQARAGIPEYSGGTTPGQERRIMPRFFCEGPVQMWPPGQISAIGATLRDLSLVGCFVRVEKPLPRGTELRLSISLFGMTVRAQGVVRNLIPGEGMGIHFTALQPQDILPLNAVLTELSRKQTEGRTGKTPGPGAKH